MYHIPLVNCPLPGVEYVNDTWIPHVNMVLRVNARDIVAVTGIALSLVRNPKTPRQEMMRVEISTAYGMGTERKKSEIIAMYDMDHPTTVTWIGTCNGVSVGNAMVDYHPEGEVWLSILAYIMVEYSQILYQLDN